MSHTRELFFLCFLSIVSTILFLVSFSLVSAATITLPPNNLGLIGYWSFDDESGTVATDHSGNGNDGTLNNMTEGDWVSGKKGGALEFDGVDDYVSISNSSSLDSTGVSGDSYTVALWIKTTQQDFVGVLSKYEGGGGVAFPYAVAVNDCVSNKTGFFIYTGSGSTCDTDVYSNTSVNDGEWHYVVGVRDGSNLHMYVDGVLENTGSISDSDYSNNSPITIGAYNSGDYYFSGSIDDVRIYNRALTSTDIQALYNSGTVQRKTVSETNLIGHWTFDDASGDTATDSSGNSNIGTLQGDPVWTNGKKGGALEFDGVNDYIDTPDDGETNGTGPLHFEDTDNFTLSIWYKGTDTDTNSDWGKGLIGSHSPDLWSSFVLRSGKVEYIHFNGSWQHNIQSTTNVADGEWHHIVYVNNSDQTGDLYIDGVQEVSGESSSLDDASRKFVVHTLMTSYYHPNSRVYTSGSIDDVRIYNTALSPEEIKTLYNETQITINSSQNNKLTDGLVGLWSFDGPDIAITQGGGGADYTVSGAGDSAFNGDYYEYGTNEGQPTYRLDDGHWISNSFDEWYLALDEEVSMCPGYYSIDDTITGTWDTICSSGPAPTVTAGGGGDSSATAYDRSGNSNDGTLTGDPTPDRGIIGQALRFDGSDDYVDLSAYPTNGSLDKEVTLAAWIKTGSGGVIFGKRNDWTTANDFTFDIVSGAAGTRVDWGNSGSILSYQSNDSSLLDDEWHHVVVVVDSSLAVETERVKFYHDGLYVGTTGTPSGGGALSQDDTLDLNDSIDLAIGARRINVGGESFFNGLIDDPRIYNRALSASEVMQLYKLGARE